MTAHHNGGIAAARGTHHDFRRADASTASVMWIVRPAPRGSARRRGFPAPRLRVGRSVRRVRAAWEWTHAVEEPPARTRTTTGRIGRHAPSAHDADRQGRPVTGVLPCAKHAVRAMGMSNAIVSPSGARQVQKLTRHRLGPNVKSQPTISTLAHDCGGRRNVSGVSGDEKRSRRLAAGFTGVWIQSIRRGCHQ